MATHDRQRRELSDRLAPVVTALGFDLDDLVLSRVGRRMVVRVTIDSDSGVAVDDIAEVSRALDKALDSEDPFTEPFVLEVSSPGVDRPLRSAKHWQRNAGRLVAVRQGERTITGRIVGADATTVRLQVEGTEVELPLHSLEPGRVQVEFNRPGPSVAAEPELDAPGGPEAENEEA